MREWSRNCAGQGAANMRRSCPHTETPKREREGSTPRRLCTQSGFSGPAALTAPVSFLEMQVQLTPIESQFAF